MRKCFRYSNLNIVATAKIRRAYHWLLPIFTTVWTTRTNTRDVMVLAIIAVIILTNKIWISITWNISKLVAFGNLDSSMIPSLKLNCESKSQNSKSPGIRGLNKDAYLSKFQATQSLVSFSRANDVSMIDLVIINHQDPTMFQDNAHMARNIHPCWFAPVMLFNSVKLCKFKLRDAPIIHYSLHHHFLIAHVVSWWTRKHSI